MREKSFRKGIIVIPAYNEESNIETVLSSLRSFAKPRNLDILVVNDGSTDKTEKLASKYADYVLSHPFNIGYGAAVHTGLKFALEMNYDFAILFDADGQHDVNSIDNLLSKKDEYDIVLGSRFLSNSPYKLDLFKKLGIKVMRFLLKILCGLRLTDPTTGFQLLNKKALEVLAKDSYYPHDFPDADVIYKLWKSKLIIGEVPVVMYPRKSGTSMHNLGKGFYYFTRLLLSIFAFYAEEKNKEV